MVNSVNNGDKLIDLIGVNKSFAAPEKGRIAVLQDVNIQVRRGEIVAVLGRSGCGKSTLLRIICGLTTASSGKVLYRGRSVRKPVPGISLVFQSFALFPWLNVLGNVELGLEAQNVPPAERRERALAVIDMIGLDGFESAYPKELSGGMRQRVGFARALVVNPDVLLMDEAFSSLDVPTAETLRTDLLDLWVEHLIPTQAILMVSHNIEEALLLADRIVIFEANPGRVKAEVPITLKHPRDRESVVFRQLVERVYTIMTTPVVPSEAELARLARPTIGHRLPRVTVAQMTGVLDVINQPANAGSIDLPVLAETLQMEVNDIFPILEALELLDFAHVAGRRVTLMRHGRAFAEADIQRRKVIFGEHLLRRVPLAAHIRRVLDERPSQRAPSSRFLRELEDYLPEQDAEGVLEVIIDWGRYAELFAYDSEAGIFSTENPGAEVET
ncbi:MAG TPA: nitrate/sulfonate/bicarbonate ABC transporter ATP-binding protein [Candidatus Methylomirabilis sp.]|nr:nitrate/sulfonate/bicarbonate ABC transporter ATP-binding protein [Candidatus Methylomirabilis sp.]